MNENKQDVALDEEASPTKQFSAAKLSVIPENGPTFSDRVARLSISEDASASQNIIDELKNSIMEGEGNRKDKRRRRSSAQSLNSTERNASNDNIENIRQNTFEERRGSKKARKKAKKEAKKEAKEEAHIEVVLQNSDAGLHNMGRRKRERLMLTHGISSIEKLGDRVSSINDLREPLISCLYGKILDASNLKIRSMLSIKKIIVIFVPGLQPEDLGKPADISFKDIGPFEVKNSTILSKLPLDRPAEAFPLSSPGSKNSLYPAYNHFINRLLSKREKKLRQEELSSQKITINNLLMSLDDLIEHDYPIHSSLLNENTCQDETDEGEAYVDTKKFDHDGSHIFALDCEMCLSEKGYVLTRVSVVDFDGNIVYDQLVKPSVPITDYLTKYSGITEEKLASVTTTLQDVQRDILNMVSENDVLVGHSLENDLNALKIRHPNIVDTSVIYEHRAGPPFRPALRNLTSTYLNYNIQTGEKVGHNPVEDAKACMDLVKLKIVGGLTFGVSVSTENIFHKLSNSGIKSLKIDHDALKTRSTELSNSDKKIFESLSHRIDDYRFIVARLNGLALSRGYAYNISIKPNKEKKDQPSESQSLDVLSQGLCDLYEKSPGGTMVTIVSGNGDTRPYSKILAELETIDKDQRTKARQERSEELEEAVGKARDGVAVVFFKQQTLND